MQAIVVKYHSPTDSRGSRFTASANAGRVTVPYDHSLGSEENHRAAAKALQKKMGWKGTLTGGVLPDGHSYVYTQK